MKAGLSPRLLAEKIGRDVSWVRHVESGDWGLTIDMAKRCAEACGVDLGDFLGANMGAPRSKRASRVVRKSHERKRGKSPHRRTTSDPAV